MPMRPCQVERAPAELRTVHLDNKQRTRSDSRKERTSQTETNVCVTKMAYMASVAYEGSFPLSPHCEISDSNK